MKRNIGTTARLGAILAASLIAIGATALPASIAGAQTAYPAEVENQCRADYFRFCSPYALGSDELRRCMEVNGKALASSCQQALKDAGLVRQTRANR